MAEKDKLRTGEKNFWDKAFEAEINSIIVQTKAHYIEYATSLNPAYDLLICFALKCTV